MAYKDLKEQMPDATFLYADVTPEEAEAVMQTHWRIPAGTLYSIGTQELEISLTHRVVVDDSLPE